MPRVTIPTGIFGPDGREEELSEFLCDAPDCPNIATEAIGCLREFGQSAMMCAEHAGTRGARSTATRKTRDDESL